MRPFDLPPDNLDRLHAALCLPEVRKSYLSNPPDAEDHERVERIEQQTPPSLPEPLPPGRMLITPPQRPQPRIDGSFIFGVPLPLLQSASEPPPGRFVS